MASYNIIDKYYEDYLIHNKRYFDVGINENFLYMSELEKLNSLGEVNNLINSKGTSIKNDSYLVIEYINIKNIKKYKSLDLPKLIINIDNENIEISKLYSLNKDKIKIRYIAKSKNKEYNFEREIPYLLDENKISSVLKDNGFSEINKVKYNNFKFKNIEFYINYIKAKKLDPLLRSTPEYEIYDENYKIDNKSFCCNSDCSNCNKCNGCKKNK